MDGAREQVIDVLRQSIQQLTLRVDDIFIVADGRAGLSLTGGELMHLTGGLVDERQEGIEGDAVFLQQLTGKVVAVVHKVTGKDGTQVQVTPVGRREGAHVLRNRRGQRLHPKGP